jgi:hypothetical protein
LKKIILSSLFLSLTLSSADVFGARIFEKLEQKKLYFSALNLLLKEGAKKGVPPEDSEHLERLVKHTGEDVLHDYEVSLLKNYTNPAVQTVLARKALEQHEADNALSFLERVPADHFYYPEALFLRGQAYQLKNNPTAEYQSYTECWKSAQKRLSQKDKDVAHHFQMLAEVCYADMARVRYEMGQFKKSLEIYNRVPKNSYKWPYLLLERAWAYYKLGDYNRALGLLVTYKSPLLDTYFLPEAEYLAALIYFRLCLFKDATAIVNHYDQVYRPRFESLGKVLKENKSSNTFFFNLMFSKKKSQHSEFVKHIMTRLKKQSRFNDGVKSILEINREIKNIKQKESAKFQKVLIPHLKEVKKNIVYSINAHARKDIFTFLNRVKFFSGELFKINLEIISETKEMIYDNKKLVSERSRGDLSNVQREKFEYFWTFEQAFWADELGDYSFGLKSNCQTVSKDKK